MNPFPATSMPDRDWWSTLFPQPRTLMRRMGVTPGLTVLDLCCGDGFFTAAISAITGGRVYGLDISADLIEQAEIETRTRGHGALGWIVADAMQVADRLSAHVDYVLVANTLHGVADPSPLLAEASRVLRPGGVIGVVNWLPLPREETLVLGAPRGPDTKLRQSPEELRAAFSSAGLIADGPIGLPPYHYGMCGRRPDEPSHRSHQ